jgi:hypothetical protein
MGREASDAMNLQDKVNEALDCAVFMNCYVELMSYDAQDVADDLVEYDELFKGLEAKDIIDQVKDYLHWYHHDRVSNERRGTDENSVVLG